MRVKDDVRVTSVVQRLKVGERFTDADGDWEVVRPTVVTGNIVEVFVLPYPSKGNQRIRTYLYDFSFQVKMIRN